MSTDQVLTSTSTLSSMDTTAIVFAYSDTDFSRNSSFSCTFGGIGILGCVSVRVLVFLDIGPPQLRPESRGGSHEGARAGCQGLIRPTYLLLGGFKYTLPASTIYRWILEKCGMPSGRMPRVRYWLWVSVGAAVAVGFVVGLWVGAWWLGLIAAGAVLVTPTGLYALNFRLKLH